MGIRLPICIALALAGTLHVSANVVDMRCEYRTGHILRLISTLAFYPADDLHEPMTAATLYSVV